MAKNPVHAPLIADPLPAPPCAPEPFGPGGLFQTCGPLTSLPLTSTCLTPIVSLDGQA